MIKVQFCSTLRFSVLKRPKSALLVVQVYMKMSKRPRTNSKWKVVTCYSEFSLFNDPVRALSRPVAQTRPVRWSLTGWPSILKLNLQYGEWTITIPLWLKMFIKPYLTSLRYNMNEMSHIKIFLLSYKDSLFIFIQHYFNAS